MTDKLFDAVCVLTTESGPLRDRLALATAPLLLAMSDAPPLGTPEHEVWASVSGLLRDLTAESLVAEGCVVATAETMSEDEMVRVALKMVQALRRAERVAAP